MISPSITRCHHKIEFDEKDKIITATTPAKNQLVTSDLGKSVQLQDQSGNSMKLSESGIALDAMNSISLSSKTDVNLTCLNIDCEAR